MVKKVLEIFNLLNDYYWWSSFLFEIVSYPWFFHYDVFKMLQFIIEAVYECVTKGRRRCTVINSFYVSEVVHRQAPITSRSKNTINMVMSPERKKILAKLWRLFEGCW